MAKALRLNAVWQDGGQAQVGKAITVRDNRGNTVTLYQQDGTTTTPNPTTTVNVHGAARVMAFVNTPGRYILSGPDGATKDVTVADEVQPDAPVAGTSVTGSRAANAALASLLTALAGKGIIVDNTTA